MQKQDHSWTFSRQTQWWQKKLFNFTTHSKEIKTDKGFLYLWSGHRAKWRPQPRNHRKFEKEREKILMCKNVSLETKFNIIHTIVLGRPRKRGWGSCNFNSCLEEDISAVATLMQNNNYLLKFLLQGTRILSLFFMWLPTIWYSYMLRMGI